MKSSPTGTSVSFVSTPEESDPSFSLPLLPVAVLAWGAEWLRDLPWRNTRDPWAVLVAEVMLQQTQIDRVLPRWSVFLERFPDAATCAAGSAGEVVQEWSGLGFNRRAIMLHRCATVLVKEHQGVVPKELLALLALPGVGPYTARAVQAFAFEQDSAVVDTNVGRVLARFAGHSLKPRQAQDMADASVPVGAGWAWNQAVLDLGSMVCQARAPRCGQCPIAEACVWQGNREKNGPDPAPGSAGVAGKQSRFEGSDRQGRGRLVAALGLGPVDRNHLAQVMGWVDDPERAHRVAATVVADGLAQETSSGFVLP